MSSRFRVRVAVLLLVATAVFAAVVLSQLLIASGNDPRDTIASRAAGFSFTDRAHETLYGAVPLALPLLAAALSRHNGVGLVAAVEYGVLIIIGASLSGAAFLFGLDAADQQQAAVGTVFIDTRSAIESLLVDVTMLVLATVAMFACLRLRTGDRAPERA